jgi:hypothetical protein
MRVKYRIPKKKVDLAKATVAKWWESYRTTPRQPEEEHVDVRLDNDGTEHFLTIEGPREVLFKNKIYTLIFSVLGPFPKHVEYETSDRRLLPWESREFYFQRAPLEELTLREVTQAIRHVLHDGRDSECVALVTRLKGACPQFSREFLETRTKVMVLEVMAMNLISRGSHESHN